MFKIPGRKTIFCLLILILKLTACKSDISSESKFQALSKEQIKTAIEEQVDSIAITNSSVTSCEYLQSQTLVQKYYQKNRYCPVWIDANGLSAKGDTLLFILKHSYEEGLDSSEYHVTAIEALRNKFINYKGDTALYNSIARLDILLTDGFFTYAAQQYAGCIHTATHNVEWEEHLKNISLTDSLQKTIANGQMRNILSHFVCNQPRYLALRKALHHYLDTIEKGLNKNIDSSCIDRIELNMERWRWLPHNMPKSYVMVNIAGFNLAVIDSNKRLLSMKIVVGKTYRRTPLFKSKITYITLNPWWEVPESIAEKEMLPAVKRNKNYFTKNNIKVYKGWETNATELPSDSINWDKVSASNFSYRFRQTPGPWNALGQIVFKFPNKYNVYLHDTPDKHLFQEPIRAFSHGCIRIEKPLDLAEYLLKNNAGWTKEHIVKVISSDEQAVIVTLKTPVDVYICYWTTWANDSGRVSFVPDIYNYDDSLSSALHSCRKQLNKSSK